MDGGYELGGHSNIKSVEKKDGVAVGHFGDSENLKFEVVEFGYSGSLGREGEKMRQWRM